MTKKAALLLTGIACALPASAQRVVNEWGGVSPTKWQYVVADNTIEILDSDSGVFSFETYDSSDDSPLDIDAIVVDSGIGSGTVAVTIGPDPNSSRTYGANDVATIDLTNATYGELVDVEINGALGIVVGNPFPGSVTVDEVSGTVYVGLLYTTTFNAGDITGTLSVDGFQAGVVFAADSIASLVNRGGGTNQFGTITVNGDLDGTIDFSSENACRTSFFITGDISDTGKLIVGSFADTAFGLIAAAATWRLPARRGSISATVRTSRRRSGSSAIWSVRVLSP
jgi:hypothetical protein